MSELRLENFVVRGVVARDAPALQAMFEADPAYFALAEGGPPGPAEARSLMTALPEGMGYGSKFVYGVFDAAGAPVAVLDLIRGYPDPQTWFLGLIFVAVPARNQGLGGKLLQAVINRVREAGGRKLRLAVVEGNDGALRFYARFGFVLDAVKERRTLSGKTMKVHVLEHAV